MNSEPLPQQLKLNHDLWQTCAPLIGRHLNMFSFVNELPGESHQVRPNNIYLSLSTPQSH